MLSTTGGSSAEIARQAASFKRHADPQGLIEESRRAVAGVADALAEDYPNLSRLLRAPTPAGPPLLAAAFCYFFRREVETDDELAHGLFFDGLRQLSASQARAFGEVGKAPAALGGQFDAVFEQLGRVEAAVAETHGAVLDVQTELRRLGGLHLANAGAVRTLLDHRIDAEEDGVPFAWVRDVDAEWGGEVDEQPVQAGEEQFERPEKTKKEQHRGSLVVGFPLTLAFPSQPFLKVAILGGGDGFNLDRGATPSLRCDTLALLPIGAGSHLASTP